MSTRRTGETGGAVKIRQSAEKYVRADEVTKLASRLLRTPSYQTERLEREPMVASLVRDIVRPELEARGLRDVSIDEMGNLIARVSPGRGGRSLMLLAYAMTAAPGTMREPFSGRVGSGARYGCKGEIVWGRGACEQKASLAAAIESVHAIKQSGIEPRGEVVLVVSTAGETGRHDSLKQVVENDCVKTDYAVVTLGEPTIQLGHKGRLDVEITVEGKACHSSTPWEGVNAVDGAMLVLQRLKQIPLHDPRHGPVEHPALGRATLTVTSIESSPKASHTVQASCKLTVDRRLLPGEDPDAALAEIVGTIGGDDPFKVKVKPGAFMYPSEVSKDSEIAVAVADGVRRVLRREPQYSYMHAAIDTGYLNTKGIQAVNFGAANMKLAHTDIDYASVDDIVNAARVYAYLALAGIDEKSP